MTIYPGNPSLSTAVKERVGSTFQQAVALYKEGRTEEVLAGCTLILQMDPQFDPARKLIEKVRNPASPVDIDSLAPLGSANEALEEARRAMATRDFQRVINLTTEILTDDLMNDDARILGDEAREKMEAAPFVEQFAKKCDTSLAAGNLAGARNDLEKARALDPAHPAVRRIEQALLTRGTGAAPSPQPSYGFDSPRPSFVVDNPAGPARSSAQASDFGFTFEEEKTPEKPPEAAPFAGFSFDSPAAPSNADPFANAFNAQKPAPAPPPKAETPFAGFSFDTPSAPAKPTPPQAPSSGGFTFDAPSAPAASSGGGFSFDAPSSGGFGFDAPASPGTPFTSTGAGAEFDFSTASIETSPDDQRKIDQYLADGDRAFQAADYQQAIDLWSRIFLIDVTNEQASERIERAKIRRREIEQKADAIIGVAVQAFERKDFTTAQARFEEVLFIDPQNTAAIDYLDRIHESTSPAAAAPTIEAPYVAPEAESFDIFADQPRSASETPLIPPDPGTIPTPAGKGKTGKVKAVPAAGTSTAKRSLPIGLLITILVLLLLGAGGWFAYQKFAAKPDYDPAATQALFTQAGSLAARGKYDQAIAVLQDVKPEDPQHDKAVGMIADLQHKKGQAAELIQGKPASQYIEEQIAAGQAAFAAHDYDGAKKLFETAAHVKPLPPEAKALYDTAAQQVAKLDAAKNLFRERKFADALANLGPMLQTDPQNKNIQRMILDAHFNLGASALQEDRLPDAIREFDEVLRVDPSDDLAKRSKELANRYTGQPKDLLYMIYVKYLPLRQVS